MSDDPSRKVGRLRQVAGRLAGMVRPKDLPPGQYVSPILPVLHYGAVPAFEPATWDFRVFGLVQQPLALSYAEMLARPVTRIQTDIHCVTRWSVLGTTWEGFLVRDLLAQAGPLPAGRFVLVHAENGFTTNLPLGALLDDDVLLAHRYNDAPLSPAHGHPLRLVVPKLYFWKSAKWVRGFEVMEQDKLGFWEGYGYHNDADPWQEQRFASRADAIPFDMGID